MRRSNDCHSGESGGEEEGEELTKEMVVSLLQKMYGPSNPLFLRIRNLLPTL